MRTPILLSLLLMFLSCKGLMPGNLTRNQEPSLQDPIPLSPGDFSIIVLPDTQTYLAYDSKNYMFEDQINWIIEKQIEENIVMVLHEGDMINSFSQPGVSEPEWNFFSSTMSKLDQAGIPYGVVPGNHDYGPGGRDLEMMNHYLPLSRFQDMGTYGGCYEEGKSDNTYHRFSAGGKLWLILLLEFGPRDEVLDWASTLTATYSDHLVIMVTHGYLDEQEFRLDHGDNHSPDNGFGLSDVNNGVEMWEKLVSQYENFRMVLCGHTGRSSSGEAPADGGALLRSRGVHGNTVYEMMANYQYYSFSESGFLRILRFHINPPSVDVITYAPCFDRYYEDSQHQFSLIPFKY